MEITVLCIQSRPSQDVDVLAVLVLFLVLEVLVLGRPLGRWGRGPSCGPLIQSQKSISSQFSPPRYNFGDLRSFLDVHFYKSFSHVVYHFHLTNGNTESVIDFMILIIFHISPYWGHENVLWVLYGAHLHIDDAVKGS